MKLMKKISTLLAALILSVSCFSIVSFAADGRISFTDPETAVGDMVEVRCVARSTSGNLGEMEIQLSYDPEYLRFDSGDNVEDDGEGTLTYTGTGSSAEGSFTVTFQALQEGSTQVTVASASIASDAGAELTLDQGNSTVKIAEGDPSKIEDTEEDGDSKKSKSSAKSSENDMQVEVDGVSYTLTDGFADADIPTGYTKTTVTLDGSERQMVTNEANTVYLAYLVNSEDLGEFFIYNEEDATFAPYEEVSISDTTSILILSDTSKVNLPSNYKEAKLTLNEKEFPVWQNTDTEGYYVLYAMNNNGEEGYYQLDSAENTYQRFEVPDETDEPKQASGIPGMLQNLIGNHFMIFAIIVGIILLLILILIIVLAVKLRNRNIELDDLYDEYGIDLEDEEPEMPVSKGKAAKGKKKKYEDDFDEDDFDLMDDSYDDEDDFDEEDYEDDYEEDYEDDFDEDDFDEEDYEEEDFEEYEDDDEDDIFGEANVGKYDTSSYQESLNLGGLNEDHDLSELFDDLSDGKKSRSKKKEENYTIDFIDLD